MSRTYRRKGKAPKWVTHEFVYDKYSILNVCKYVKLEDAELKSEIASYHSDSPRWTYQGSIPGWFCTMWGHRHDRRVTKRALHKEFYALEKGDVVFDKTINIDWEWW